MTGQRAPIVYLGVGIYYERADGARNFLVGSSMSRDPQHPIDLDEVQRNAARHVHGLIEEARLLVEAEVGQTDETGKVAPVVAALTGRPATWPPPEPIRVDTNLSGTGARHDARADETAPPASERRTP